MLSGCVVYDLEFHPEISIFRKMKRKRNYNEQEAKYNKIFNT